jgi:spermidine/putrescine ABC transporter ATP-binding subunit
LRFCRRLSHISGAHGVTKIIEILNLTKTFGDVRGVDNISLDIEEGEFVTLLGPSGCGKSTLLRMIGGFEDPTQGRIKIDGQDVTHVPPSKRAVNMVFQDYALFPHLNVGKNVGYGLRVAGVPKAEVREKTREALALVGLEDRFDAMPHMLSGGQRQRVALARAIVRRPKVLLLDEPLSALDANLREQMQVELKALHTKVGLTFVLVTHDQNEALTMSDRIVVMRAGKIVQIGSPQELYENPQTGYVAGFIGSTNIFRSKIVLGANGPMISCFGHPLTGPQMGAADEALFGFRPEKAQLLRPDTDATNVLRGTVMDVLYHGQSARVVVDLGAGQVVVDMPITEVIGAAGLPRIGTAVALSIAPHKIMVLQDEVTS